VYNGDFIRTAEHSEAAIGFPDGTLVGISENSLIRIFVEEGVARLDFSRGNVSVHAGQEGSVVSFGGNRIQASAGAVLNLDAGTGEEFNLQVLEGEASLITPNGEQEAAAGTAVSLNAEGTESVFRPVVLEPPPAARFLTLSDDPLPVQFAWNDPDAAEVPARIEIAGNRDFRQPVTVWEGNLGETNGTAEGFSEITAALPPGTWWWRVSAGDPAGGAPEEIRASGQLTVARVPPPEPVSPAPEAVYYYRTEPPELRFQWKGPEDVQYYVLEVADNPGMDNPALRTEVRYNSLVYSHLAEGRWYWRITPVFPALYRGTVPVSPVVPFTVVRDDPPAPVPIPVEVAEVAETAAAVGPPQARIEAPPEIRPPPVPPAPPPQPAPPRPLPAASGRKPESGHVIDSDTLGESRNIVFTWDPVTGADAYAFTLFRETESGERQPVVSFEGPETSYTLDDLSLLDLGGFVWRVEAFSREADGTTTRSAPGENRFVVNIPQPDTPRVRDPGALYGR
jgi:hypothetical protein